jgi:hypothetical protein
MKRLLLASFLLMGESARAQELEPRSYSPSPVGTTFVLAGFGGSKGGILFDPSLDLEDVEADLHVVTTGFGYTFSLAGRQARLLAVFPSAWGTIAGEVDGEVQTQEVSGLVDPRIKLSVGLVGAPALRLAEFAKAPPRTAVGASLTVVPPLGQYDRRRLVNLGYNRWAFKPEIGLSHPQGRWTFDGYAGVWLFTTNDRYFPGSAARRQDPVLSLQGHASYTFPSRVWVALDATWFAGGQTNVDRLESPDLQRNARLGATLSLPLGRYQSVKIAYSTGATTRRGSDFDSVTVTWQLVRF